MDEKIIEKTFNVLTNKDISPTAKVVYSVLCSGSERTKDNPDVYINAYDQDQLRELTGINSKTTIIKAVKELESKKLIGVMKGKLKNHRYNVYIIY